MMKNRPVSPPFVSMDASSVLRFLSCSVVIFFTTSHFVKILTSNLTRYCVCSPYCSLYV
jgi:hypothetical protein